MPYKKTIREAFEPEHIEVAVQAYERALQFVLASGDGDGDPDVRENVALQVIAAGHESTAFTFLDLVNRAISRYRVRRAMLLVAATRRERHAAQSRAKNIRRGSQ